ncbi:TIR domain-containing protein [Actinoplanes sp. NPDC026670]|uniref:TIR domain-containing protein n=1 Tax=Actinoplanes sp. NPDC026670 TaxID=3154700 RepID=UPI0033C50AA2
MTFNGFISYSHAADGRLAPAVQHGLHRLAKPWHRRRALWIFRDQTGLSVTPALWSSIQEALDGSDWFVLLASPEAAQSPWVNREIEHWIATKPADRILPVVTDGEWRWDPYRGDLSADSTAVPDALRGVFAEEPLFLDLRWTRDDQSLSLKDARFRDAIAQLAAPMHGLSKDELEGEDVRQHRRSRRLRRGAVAALALLTAVASITGVVAGHNADRATVASVDAQRQRELAAQERGNADRFAEEARRQQENARAQEARAHAAAVETKTQEQLAREQQKAAERAAAEARRQQENARKQQQLANRSRALAEEQQKVAREQRELAAQAARATEGQRLIAEQQQLLAEQATAEAEKQRTIARRQQWIAEQSAAEARRQEAIARENERKAKEAAEEARRQEENAAEQKRITLVRRLINRATAALGNDPAMALRLGIAAEKIQPGAETRAELAGLVTSTRRVGATDDVLAMAYGANDIMAVIGADYTLSLWSMAAPALPVRLVTFDDFPVFSFLSFGRDGKTLTVVGGWDLQPLLIDVSNPAEPVTISTVPTTDAVQAVLSPDGRTLAAGDFDGLWTLWDVADRENPARLGQIMGDSLTPITFSPDSRTVVAAGFSRTTGTVWDITDRMHPTQLATLDGKVRRAVFNPVRPLMATHDPAGSLSIWDMGDPAKPKKLYTEAVRAADVTFSSDGLTLATSDRDGTARLWDLTENTPVHLADVESNDGAALTMAFSPDGRILSTVAVDGTLSLWTVKAHGAPKIIGRATGENRIGVMAALSSDGRRLTTAHVDGTASTWDLSDPARPVERATVRVVPGLLDAAAVSPDGDLLAAVNWSSDGFVTLTDLSDPSAPAPIGNLPVGPFSFTLEFGPDGRTLAVAEGTDVMLWDLTDPRNPVRLPELPGDEAAGPIAFSPDGGTVAVAESETVSLWSLADRSKPVRAGRLKGHSAFVSSMAFSPDGRTLATGSSDRTAALWDVAGPIRRRQAILTGNTTIVDAVAFSPDGRTLATGTRDSVLTLWDVAEPSTPQRVGGLKGAELRSRALLFHPDGHTLVTSGRDQSGKRAAVWDYSDLNALRAAPSQTACAVTGGGFTPDEWAAYVPETPYQPTCPR